MDDNPYEAPQTECRQAGGALKRFGVPVAFSLTWGSAAIAVSVPYGHVFVFAAACMVLVGVLGVSMYRLRRR
jgi:hypothetical protein